MVAVPRGRLIVALPALVVLLAGCTGGPPSGAGDDTDNGPSETAPAPYLGLMPGVETLALVPGAPGVVTGVVYDLASGRALDGATVTARCATSSLGGTQGAVSLVTGSTGSFELAPTPALAACTPVVYEVQLDGYTLSVPLASSAITPGVQHIVRAGMVPIP